MGLLDHAASHLQDVKSLGILEEVCPTAAMISRSTAYCLGMAGSHHLQQNATLITSDVQGTKIGQKVYVYIMDGGANVSNVQQMAVYSQGELSVYWGAAQRQQEH